MSRSARVDVTAKSTRLAELDTALARMRTQHDVLISAFRFDEAKALVESIEAAERERAALVEALPIPAAPRPAPYRVVRRRR